MPKSSSPRSKASKAPKKGQRSPAKATAPVRRPEERLVVRGAREHNLKDVHLDLPREKLVVITGLSGSGKSSLAFDTIYAEGQRRYVESLSAYARQFLGLMEKPDVDAIEGLSPAISIEQKTVSRNPRSTVGTVTEIYDYLRLLWARAGTPHCPTCGDPIIRQSATQIVERLLSIGEGVRVEVLAPLIRGRKGEFKDLFEKARKEGFVRVRVDGETYDLTEAPSLNRYENHDIAVVVDRLVIRESDRERIADSVETALRTGDGVIEVLEHRKKKGDPVPHVFSEHYACDNCGTSLAELEPRQFSFNSPYGACDECGGLGTRKEVNPHLLTADPSLTMLEGVILPWGDPSGHLRRSVIVGLAEAYEFDPNTPWGQLPEDARDAVIHGSGTMKIRFPYKSGSGRFDGHYEDHWEGVLANVERRYRETQSEQVRNQLDEYMSTLPCTACAGSRLKDSSRAVTIAGSSLGDIVEMSIAEAAEFFEGVRVDSGKKTSKSSKGRAAGANGTHTSTNGKQHAYAPLPGEIAGPILKEVRERLRFLRDVGLEYLTLGRASGTLSGGEAQRIRLATQIGSRLVGVLYILDEPSIGLHQRDNARLLGTLERLRDLGNTVLVVEHDEDTILMADHIVDMGPGAGRHGGEVAHRGLPPWRPRNRSPGGTTCHRPGTGGHRAGRERAQPPEGRRRLPTGHLPVCDRCQWLRQVDARQRYPLPSAGSPLLPEQEGRGGPRRHRRSRSHRQGHRRRSVTDRSHAPVEPGDVYRTLHPHPGPLRESARVSDAGVRARALLVQREGRALRVVSG